MFEILMFIVTVMGVNIILQRTTIENYVQGSGYKVLNTNTQHAVVTCTTKI